MSPNRRILLNILATYGRSLYALVCGLFISRWVLAALGKTDFGLYGVVSGMMVIDKVGSAFLRCILLRMTDGHGAWETMHSLRQGPSARLLPAVRPARNWRGLCLFQSKLSGFPRELIELV